MLIWNNVYFSDVQFSLFGSKGGIAMMKCRRLQLIVFSIVALIQVGCSGRVEEDLKDYSKYEAQQTIKILFGNPEPVSIVDAKEGMVTTENFLGGTLTRVRRVVIRFRLAENLTPSDWMIYMAGEFNKRDKTIQLQKISDYDYWYRSGDTPGYTIISLRYSSETLLYEYIRDYDMDVD